MQALKSLVFGLAIAALSVGIYPAVQEKPDHPAYWHQRASHFRLLPNEEGEIIMLGDSITEGCNWSEMFANPKLKNRGISGDVTQGVLDRLDEVLESHPERIFLMIGINDLGHGKTEEEILANIKRIIREVRKKSPESTLYLESLLPVNPDFAMFPTHTDKTQQVIAINTVLRRMAADYDAVYVDLYSRFVTQGGKLDPAFTNDGLHLTGPGYAIWKKALEPYLR